MAKQAYSPDDLPEKMYSHAIVSEGSFNMAGQVAADADGNIVGDDLETQTRKVFENIGVLLDEAGKDFDDVAKVTVYIVGEQDSLDGYSRVYEEVFDDPYPCQTVLGTRSISDSGVLIEIEVDVLMGEHSRL